jgi:D-alanyl-D-alanine carboxypeptidase
VNVIAGIQDRMIADVNYIPNEREIAFLEGYLATQAAGAVDKTPEGKMLSIMSTSDDPAERAQAVAGLKRAIDARMPKLPTKAAEPKAPEAGKKTERTIVDRGTQGNKKFVKYSDGTIEEVK